MATEAATTVAEASKAGMPQLDFNTFTNQIFWLVIALVVIYLVLSRVALPRIGSVLAERKGTITNDLAAAEQANAKAVEAEAAYQAALTTARAEAGKIIAQAKADIKQDLDAATAEADAAIAVRTAESEAAIADIRAGAAEAVNAVALETADALVVALGGSADGAAIAAAVTRRLQG